jgi:hypothetical protein
MDPHDLDDEDMTWPQGDVPGVAALAGLDPAEDLRRENGELRSALLLALVQLRNTATASQLTAEQIANCISGGT